MSILWRKNARLTHLIIHLGLRENPYTLPTCTCPLKPDNVRIHEIWESSHGATIQGKQNLIQNPQNKERQIMHENRRRRIAVDALSNQKLPTKRIKLITDARPKRPRRTTREPPTKRKMMHKGQGSRYNKQRHSYNYFQNSNCKTTITLSF